MKMSLEDEIKELREENRRLKQLLAIEIPNDEILEKKIDINSLIDIEQLKILFEKFSNLTGYTTGLVKQDTRDVLISTGWTDICKNFHRGSKSSEYICMNSNKELTKNLEELQQISLKECEHGMVDGATPIIIDGEHLADLFSGQVLFHKPDIENFKLGAEKFGYDMEGYLAALDEVKITSKTKLEEVLEFLSYLAKNIAELGKEKKNLLKSIHLNNKLEQLINDKTKEQDMLLSLFDRGETVLFKWNNDKEWSVDYVSMSVERLLGYTPQEFIENKITYLSCIHDDDLPRVMAEVESATASGKDSFKHQIYRVITKDGNIKWVKDRTVIIKDNDDITYFLGNINDITEEKIRDEMYAEHSKLASMGEMIGSIAHQWRQPLNELGINIQKLKYNNKADEIDELFIEEFIQENKNIIKFMSNTIDDFRNFFRLDKIKENFSVKMAITDTLSIQSAQLSDYKISIELDGDDFDIVGYKGEFQQVILNIINNAKDEFIEKEVLNRAIKIKLFNKKITIEDNAGGIDEQIIHRIFEPYFTTKQQGKGTGIGLYMSKMIIEENMQGTLKIFNKDTGAQFKIEF